MDAFHEQISEYKKQIEKGAIQKAYQGLIEYIMGLRKYFKNKYPDYSVSGSIYQGFMDMSYFSIIPPALKEKKLKIAIVFLYEEFRFEVWLSGQNKQVLTKYWEMINDSGWDKYKIVKPGKGIDSIVEHVLVENPDFRELDGMTEQIESETSKFIREVETFISQHKN